PSRGPGGALTRHRQLITYNASERPRGYSEAIMRLRQALIPAALCAVMAAQQPPQTPPGGGGGGRGGRGNVGGFVPGQQRKPEDPAQVDRGKTIYGISCTGCHGADLRGGDMGGPNLLRSQLTIV